MRVAIYGIGNVLAHDDAVGPSVARMLEAGWEFPDDVVVEDLGTPTIEFPTHLSGVDAVILVDAVSATAPPGTIRVYDRDEILRIQPGLRVSQHDPALRETLLMLDLTGEGPSEVTLVGVVPEAANMGIGLSAPVQAALNDVCDTVVRELARIGYVARKRDVPHDADLWWAA